MKNKELFDKTVSILVKAYQNDTLEYADCSRCAVGNLISAAGYIDSSGWGMLIDLGEGTVRDCPNGAFKELALRKIKSTGYTVKEIALIEFAFANGTCYEDFKTLDDENFSGLMAVLDSLMIIHEASGEETESAKLLFVK